MSKDFEDLIRSLEQEKLPKPEEPKTLTRAIGESVEKVREARKARGIGVFDWFRYALTLLLVAVKLGLFSYLAVNPLVGVSWLIVFLPAFIVELGVLVFFLIVIIAALIFGVLGLIFAGIMSAVDRFKFRRNTKWAGGKGPRVGS